MRFNDVQKPSRYTGGEYGVPTMKKNPDVNFCLCFPDTYEVGMSNLGMRILYFMLNEMDSVNAERCFAPLSDFRDYLKENNLKLSSLETKTPLKNFDVIGFSLQFELCYTNALYMLDLAGIPFKSADRGEDYPIVIAGGPCTVNATPLHNFIDLVFVGDSEETLKEFALLCKNKSLSKGELIKKANKIDGVYAPALLSKGGTVKRAFVKNLDETYFPAKAVVPNLEIVHDRAVVELFRGCSNGCRFCQAGFIYRPVRERKLDTLTAICTNIIKFTGYDELSLNSLSTGDFSALKELIKGLQPMLKQEKVQLSLPSLRLDSFEGGMASSNRLSSLTFAPEAGTQRLRDVINKNITDEDILSGVGQAFEQGFSSVKLYFMIGLPTETMEDIEGIVKLVFDIKKLYGLKKKSGSPLRMSVSVSTFIPKPHTPFQWEMFDNRESINEKQNYLRSKLRVKNVSLSWSDYGTSLIEAVFARGDEKLGAVLETAYRSGTYFDSWTEHFNFEIYKQAFEKCGLDFNNYVSAKDAEKPLAWDFVDTGVKKDFLLKEKKNAYAAKQTSACSEKCSACGLSEVCDVCR